MNIEVTLVIYKHPIAFASSIIKNLWGKEKINSRILSLQTTTPPDAEAHPEDAGRNGQNMEATARKWGAPLSAWVLLLVSYIFISPQRMCAKLVCVIQKTTRDISYRDIRQSIILSALAFFFYLHVVTAVVSDLVRQRKYWFVQCFDRIQFHRYCRTHRHLLRLGHYSRGLYGC